MKIIFYTFTINWKFHINHHRSSTSYFFLAHAFHNHYISSHKYFSVVVKGNKNGNNHFKTASTKTYWDNASPQPSTMEYDNPNRDAKIKGWCFSMPSSHCEGEVGACFCCNFGKICARDKNLCMTLCI